MVSFVSRIRTARFALLPVVLLLGAAHPAAAGLITLDFAGTVSTGWDSSNLFGGGNLTGNSFTASITFDPLNIGKNSCGDSTSTTSCNWSASGASSFAETLTMIVGGKSYTQSWSGSTTSSLSVSSSSHDAMYLSFGGVGYSFSLNLVAAPQYQDAFFTDQKNVNTLSELYFKDVALNQKSTAEYGSAGSTSFTLQFASISAGTQKTDTPSDTKPTTDVPSSGGSTTVAVPEPSTFAMFGLAMLGLAGLTRRRRSTAA